MEILIVKYGKLQIYTYLFIHCICKHRICNPSCFSLIGKRVNIHVCQVLVFNKLLDVSSIFPFYEK
jgi:hypothetical protein